ncbi:MAG: glycosyltransferase [Chloroflexi bacterium HGW-Chloroflexi-4]|jgi:sterol 3beta-glucosyltransferase|nr:MAG: glycosyltransferase [Chloroflexi bacterium HGW-Chloroflexi-4]
MITILCGGTRGDVQPYLALAIELKKLGKEVRIAVTRNHEKFVRSYGIDFFSIDMDFESLNVDKNMIREAQKADNPLKMFFSFNKMKKYGVYMVEHYYAACEGSEAIVYHPGMAIGYYAAEKLGIPSILATPFPLNKSKEQTSVILYGKAPSNPGVNLLSYKILQSMLWMASDASLKPFWKEKFGRLPADYGCPFERHTNRRHPAIVSCSNFVFPRPTDWNENIHQMGYWYLEEQDDFIPPMELVDFLNNGEKPIYIGFGSMVMGENLEKISKIILEGLATTGKRAIISGFGNLQNIPDTIYKIDNVPHSWLFSKVSAVCHHGGAGTSAAGFEAGIPSIIFPFALDQFAWAQRAYDLGVGPKPISIQKLTSEKFSESIRYAMQEHIVSNAKELAKNIATENGARDCAKIIMASLEAKND